MVKTIPVKKERKKAMDKFSKLSGKAGDKYRLNLTKKNTYKCFSRLVFHPDSFLRITWDIVLSFLIIYQSLAIPYFIVFNDDYSVDLQNFEILSNTVFLVDILLSFNTGFYFKGSLVLKHKEIIKNYIRIWFWVDVIATFPYSWLVEGIYPKNSNSNNSLSYYKASKILRIAKVVRFLRILRLLRLAKLKKTLIKIEDYITSDTIANFFVVLRLVFMSFLVAHWLACGWFLVGFQDFEQRPITWITKANIQNSSSYEQYVTSLYWAFTTISTVGYGDIVPVTIEEKVFAMFTMIVSSGVVAYTLGRISALLSKRSALENTYRETFVSTNSYMKSKKLPKNLQFRVRRYLEYMWEKQKKNKINEKELFHLLSLPLKDEIFSHINANVVKSCKVFQIFESSFVAHLTHNLEPETYAPGDSIFKEGEMSYKIFFIISGKVEIYHSSTLTSFATLSLHDHFGEIAFFLQTPRCASSRCLEFSDVLSLDRSDYERFLEKFPEASNLAENIAKDCEEGDYSRLGVKCFICEEEGHVAIRCKVMIINADQEAAKAKWLIRKACQNSEKVSTKIKPKWVRKKKKSTLKRFKAYYIIGKPLVNDERVYEDSALNKAIVNMKESLVISQPELLSTKLTEKPRFSMFIGSEISVDEKKNECLDESPIGSVESRSSISEIEETQKSEESNLI